MVTNAFPVVGVHLDLKYIIPRKEYLHRWLREIAANGINMVLLEYEDKFPYEKYSFLRHRDAFTSDELRSFLRTARECGIQVMPLVQTLSHLEFALGHDELAHLREAPDIATQINPSNPEALQFVHEMIDEVLAYHEEDEYFHLGADETWFVGTNPDYADEVQSLGLPAYWVKHLRPYIDQVMKAGKRPVAWDDIFWNDPAMIKSLDLPRELVLHSWDYGISEVEVENTSLSRVDVYQEAGFEVIGAPCLNWGVLTPIHNHVLANTAFWAHKAQHSKLSGLINTSWAVFHTPYSTQMPYIASTSALLKGEAADSDAWQTQWAKEYFGVEDKRIPDALRDLSLNWTQKIEGLGRPITPVIYGYTDLVLHYGSQELRMKSGSYPLDWNDVDFPAIYATKIRLLRELRDKAAIEEKLNELEAAYNRAAPILHEFAQRATTHQEEAALLACFSDMKKLHVQIVRSLVFGDGDKVQLLKQSEEQKPLIEKCLAPFYELAGVEELIKLWWEPANTALAA